MGTPSRNSHNQGRKARIHVEVIACPACQCPLVIRKRSKKVIAYWQCRNCQEEWKEPADIGTTDRSGVKLAHAFQVFMTTAVCYLLSSVPPSLFHYH
jgi:ribosomal protein L37AE/L43A